MASRAELQILIDEYKNWWAGKEKQIAIESEVKEPLYHYTSMQGMLGIISKEEMWFTNIFHLNDPSELGYGIKICLQILSENAENAFSYKQRFRDWMKHLLVKAGGEIFSFYVASFSAHKNDLGQWRAYADDGRGVAIGFAPPLFSVETNSEKIAATEVTERTLIGRVNYDREQNIHRVREAINKALQAFSVASFQTHEESREFIEELAREVASAMFFYSITAKHSAYEHEKETRLMLINDCHTLNQYAKMRIRGSQLVPYICSKWAVRSRAAISEVIVGPAAADLASNSVRTFLASQSLAAVTVGQSTIPYTSHR
jgi:Protein of unknown function (DUF2971)